MFGTTAEVLAGLAHFHLAAGDVLHFLEQLPDDAVDLVFGSPPYSGKMQRYGETDRPLAGRDWAAWMLEVYRVAQRVCTGLVAFVVNSGTEQFRWDAAVAHLMAMLDDVGLHQFHPCVYARKGVPGGAGKYFLRNDWEFVVCVHRPGRLPWDDRLATGKPPVFEPGGPPSHRQANGRRARRRVYQPPAVANPGDVHEPVLTEEEEALSDLLWCKVGGGLMGHPDAHDAEAPFPLALADFYVRSFCRPGGLVLDPFMGSGTTLHAALKWGRRGLGVDLRPSQVELVKHRLENPDAKVALSRVRHDTPAVSGP